MHNSYRTLGLSLCLAGAVFAPVSYFIIGSVPLAAVGLSAIMIGFASAALANARPYISPEACRLILKTGAANTEALLEELGVRNKAIYLPATEDGGHARALVPLMPDTAVAGLRGKLPERLLVRYGPNPGDMALSVATAGSMNLELLEDRPGSSAAEIQAAASYILNGVLDIIDSVQVEIDNGIVTAQFKNPRLGNDDAGYSQCVGSPIASTLAALVCEALALPTRIKEESHANGKGTVVIEVLG
jgi:hypothetical protein